jgi:hypothetical protein
MRITQSMGRVGSALGNAVIESWHSTLEFELRALERFATKAQARSRVAAWIDGLQPRPQALRLRHAQPGRLRARPARSASNTTGRLRHDQRLHRSRRQQHGAVLAGVTATPCGWPAASLDTASGRHHTAPVGPGSKDQQSKIRLTEVSTVWGDCRAVGSQAERCGTRPCSLARRARAASGSGTGEASAATNASRHQERS